MYPADVFFISNITLPHFCFWQCSCSNVAGNFPVHPKFSPIAKPRCGLLGSGGESSFFFDLDTRLLGGGSGSGFFDFFAIFNVDKKNVPPWFAMLQYTLKSAGHKIHQRMTWWPSGRECAKPPLVRVLGCGGSMVELSTPDRRVAGSIPVRVNSSFFLFGDFLKWREAAWEVYGLKCSG